MVPGALDRGICAIITQASSLQLSAALAVHLPTHTERLKGLVPAPWKRPDGARLRHRG